MSTGIMGSHVELQRVIALVLTHHFITACIWAYPKALVQFMERQILVGFRVNEREWLGEAWMLLVPVPQSSLGTYPLLAEATFQRIIWFLSQPDKR